MIFRRFARLAPLAAVAAAGCFATRNDVRLLQTDITRLAVAQAGAEESRKTEAERARVDAARRDSVLREQVRQLATIQRVLAESLFAFVDGFSRFRADQRLSNNEMGQQLAALGEIVGLSQKTVADIRAGLDARRDERPPAAIGGAAGADTTAPPAPGPRTLFQTGIDQLQKGATGVARSAFEELLKNYPADDLVPDAMFWLADINARENMDATADSVYALIVARYPKAARAPEALYKRAEAFAKAGRPSEARRLYDQLINRYPRSSLVELARDHKKQLPPP